MLAERTPPAPGTGPAPLARAGLWAAALAALGLAHLLLFPTLWDDAFIAFRVAGNWARTGLPVYNPGELQPVATSWLWLTLLAGAHKLSGLGLPACAQLLGGAAGLAAPLLLFAYAWSRGERFTGVAAALLCLASGAWAAWPLSGLETSVFGLWLLAAALLVLVHLEAPNPAALLAAGVGFGLAALTRPLGNWLWLLAWGFVLARRPGRWREWGLLAAGYALTVLPGWLLQAGLYHTLLPNAFYAKINGPENLRQGWNYVRHFAATYRLLYFVPFLLPLLGAGELRLRAGFLATLLLGQTLWVAAAGGDFMPYARFLSPGWPLFCLLAAFGLAALQRAWVRIFRGLPAAWSRAVAAVVTVFLALAVLLPSFTGPDRARAASWALEEQDRAAVGRWLGRNFPPSTLLAVKPAGIIPYYSGLRAVDFYGLADREAARRGSWIQENWPGHQRVNVGAVLARRPGLVILDEHLDPPGQEPDSANGPGAVERQWRADARSRDYAPAQAEILPGRWLHYFTRQEAVP